MSDEQVVVANLVVKFEHDQMGEGDHEVAAEAIQRALDWVVGNGALTEWSDGEVEVDSVGFETAAVEISGAQVARIGNGADLVGKLGLDLANRSSVNQLLAGLGLTPVTDFLEMLSMPGPVALRDHPCSTANAWFSLPASKGEPSKREQMLEWLYGADIFEVEDSPLLMHFNRTQGEIVFDWVADDRGHFCEIRFPVSNFDDARLEGNELAVVDEEGEERQIRAYRKLAHRG